MRILHPGTSGLPVCQATPPSAVHPATRGIVSAAAAAAAVAAGARHRVAALLLGGAAVLAVHQIARSRSLESIAYPVVGLALGRGLHHRTRDELDRITPRRGDLPSPAPRLRGHEAEEPARRTRGRLLYPLTAICAVQVGLSLTLVWSNTAYLDEANFLWVGRLETRALAARDLMAVDFAYRLLSGSPTIYPPVGALANNLGGLAGARILSLVFMLGATILLCLTASRLIGRTGALIAAALWALSEPAMRLAFATADPLSIFLTALPRGSSCRLATAAIAVSSSSQPRSLSP